MAVYLTQKSTAYKKELVDFIFMKNKKSPMHFPIGKI